jgi:hypothetical protein
MYVTSCQLSIGPDDVSSSLDNSELTSISISMLSGSAGSISCMCFIQSASLQDVTVLLIFTPSSVHLVAESRSLSKIHLCER